jgi:hypothetical protein
MDRAPNDVRHHELAGVDRIVVRLSGDALGPRCEREQRGVAAEVGGGAGRRFGETRRAPNGEPGAGQSKGENLF